MYFRYITLIDYALQQASGYTLRKTKRHKIPGSKDWMIHDGYICPLFNVKSQRETSEKAEES